MISNRPKTNNTKDRQWTGGIAEAGFTGKEWPTGGWPNVFYEADELLSVLRISPNCHQVLGIQQSHIIGSKCLLEGAVVPADRALLNEKFRLLEKDGEACLVHRLVDDKGRVLSVTHGLIRLSVNNQNFIRGSILPLHELNGRDIGIDSRSVAKFIHKLGNQFQLLHLVVDSMRHSTSIVNDLDLIQETTTRAADLTSRLSDFLQQPAITLDVKLSELLQAAVDSRLGVSHAKDVVITVHTDDWFSHVIVAADPGLLELAFGAVIDNAISALAEGGEISVDVSTLEDGPGNYAARSLTVRVTDHGSGYTAAEIDALVDPLQGPKTDPDRVGLGLASRYINMHGGLLRIQSSPGCGTVVIVELPIAQIPESNCYKSGH